MPPSQTQVAVKFLSIEIKSGVAYYTISVTDLNTKETWLFQSRYSRMRQVHDSIASFSKEDVPIFPPKRCCFNTETAFVSQRQKALENYFNIVLKNADLSELNPLKSFLYGEKSSLSQNKQKKSLTFQKGTAEDRDYNNIYLGPKKSLGLKNAVDSFAFRFVDLALNLTPPEEDEIRRKRTAVQIHKWPKIIGKLFDDLPKGNEQNLIFLKKESLIRTNEEFIICIEKAMRGISYRSLEIKDLFEPEILVHRMINE